MVRPTINSEKHIVPEVFNAVGEGTIRNTLLVHAQDVSAMTGAVQDVTTGTIIKAVWIELWMIASAQNLGSITVSVEKQVGESVAMTFAQSAQMNDYSNKKNIFYITQGIIPEQNGNPIPFIRQWIKIPKGKQRFGLNDKLRVNVAANVEAVSMCGMYIFKAYN